AEFPGLHRENTRLVPNGLRVEPQPPTALRAELGIAPDAPVVLGVGGLEARKGFQHLVTALPSLPGVHAVIAGTGPAHRKAALLDLAANLGVGDRFHLLGHRTDIPGLLEAADAFALPSQDDTMPNALLEAMAVGCPAVMTEVGGVREMLGPRGHRPAAGWVVPVDDGDALTAAIAEIIDLVRRGHPGVTERTDEARWRMRHWYGADQMVARYEALLAGRGEEAHS
ncbi:MAG TPA: glycosyltransferase family 4 protein, partial [Longimicrobiales bacterium]|nr:glycosyltransferase family 4 protein [Longimicrobiales bacterium]